MKRRAFLPSLLALAASPRLSAQAASRLGLLWLHAPEVAHFRKALLDGLAERGYRQGHNLAVDDATVDAYEKLPEAARGLVERKVHAIVTWGFTSLRVARQATSNIPIVMNAGIDPVKAGFAASLARPGGNVTGISTLNAELQGKQAQLVREILPRARRVAAILDPTSGTQTGYFGLVEAEARRLGIEFRAFEVRRAAELEPVLGDTSRSCDAVFVVPSTMFQRFSGQIGALALKHRVPSFAYGAEYADAGVMVTYGVNRAAVFRHVAGHVDRILKGARPAEMPIELPNAFELVVNLRTARALGVTIPPSVLVRADRAIQ